jgi:4-aminobutyrate aminotransferase
LQDTAGRRYMDFHGNSLHQVGYANPAVIAAIKQQLDDLPFCPRRYTNDPAVRLARKLVEVTPGNLNKVLLAPGGTSAIGMALKLARVATGRHKAISIGGEAIFRQGVGPLLPGCEHVPPADSYRCLWDCHARGGCDLKCADYIEYVLEREGDVAAVIAEPIRSTPYIPPADYWRKVQTACRKHGALLIFDEICQGLGRTGKMFACEHFEVVPDILVLGKGLGGGVLPMAALIASDELDVAADKALGHYTHEKSPVCCAAALATLQFIEDQRLVEHSRQLGEYALERLRQLQQRFQIIGDVRGIGLLLGVELVKNRHTKERALIEAEQVMYHALSRGLGFKLTMGSILTLTPPLVITKPQMDEAIDIIEQSLLQVTGG